MLAPVRPAPLAGEHKEWLERLQTNLATIDWSPKLQPLADKLGNNVPLSLEDGMTLYEHPDLHEVGALAHQVRQARFGNRAFFNSNVHINQTNICVLACRFCAFRRGAKANDAYAMSIDEYMDDLALYAHAIDEVRTRLGAFIRNGALNTTKSFFACFHLSLHLHQSLDSRRSQAFRPAIFHLHSRSFSPSEGRRAYLSAGRWRRDS